MIAKVQIVEQLGESEVLLPELLAAGLQANDRAKVGMTLLQEAINHARNPLSPPHSFEAERRSAGLTEPIFDSTVKEARALGDGRFIIPGAEALLDRIYADIGAMMAPLLHADAGKAEAFARRLEVLRSRRARAEGDVVTAPEIASMTSARMGGEDSEHLLIMDLHKALNRLEAEAAVESVAGARVHRLAPADKQRVEAFMRGLNRTRELAFGHPGLGTTATRSGARLVIQNDIGMTEAHVIVIHVEDLTVTVTYTDIHRARTKFFMGMFDGRDVHWSPLAEKSAQILGEDSQFLLVTGRHTANRKAHRWPRLPRCGCQAVHP